MIITEDLCGSWDMYKMIRILILKKNYYMLRVGYNIVENWRVGSKV